MFAHSYRENNLEHANENNMPLPLFTSSYTNRFQGSKCKYIELYSRVLSCVIIQPVLL